MPSRAPTTERAAWLRDSSHSSERAATASSPTSNVPAAIETSATALRQAVKRGRPAVLSCDPSLEGVLAGVGITYLAHTRPGQARLASIHALQPQLGEEVVRLPPTTDDDTVTFARRVLVGFSQHVTRGCRLRAKLGSCPTTCNNACVRRLVYATASDDPAMPEAVHQYLRLGFSVGPRVREMIADPRVATFDGIARFVLNECEHTRQFVRFAHLADGSFAASIAPAANTIPLVAPYFAARMGTERFCLVDTRHRQAAFHEAGARGCTLVQLDAALTQELAARRDFADDEAYVRAMWQRFYRATSLPGRDRSQRGYDLRMHWMPQRLWNSLSELDEDAAAGAPIPPARYADPSALKG